MKNLFILLYLAAGPLFSETKVLVFAGSTRAESYNRQLAQEAVQVARGMGAKVTMIDLKDYPMPFYDADLEAKEGMPKNAKRLRALMVESDAILIASPEYNASIPAVLKNALDWASRDEAGGSSRSAFKGKKFGIMSASPGKLGGSRGLVHLRAVIQDVGGEVVEKQVSVPSAYQVAMGNGALKKELQEEIKEVLRPQ